MVLDAGQKVIGPVYCDECGLLYSPGDIEDEQEHRKAHARLNNIFSIRVSYVSTSFQFAMKCIIRWQMTDFMQI